MEKPKKWQFYLIVAVFVLTLYNILPTIFYYSKPLKDPITEPRAEVVAQNIVERVNVLEEDAKEWLASFARLLGVKPASIETTADDPGVIQVAFNEAGEAQVFKKFLNRAGSLVPFVPSQLQLSSVPSNDQKTVLVSRQIDVRLDPDVKKYFLYASKENEKGIDNLYRELVHDRVATTAYALAGPSKLAAEFTAIADNPNDPDFDQVVIAAAKEIVEGEKTLSKYPKIAQRWHSSFIQSGKENTDTLISKVMARMESLKSKLDAEKQSLLKEQELRKEKGEFLDPMQEQMLAIIDNHKTTLENASAILRKNANELKNGQKPLSYNEISTSLNKTGSNGGLQVFDLQGKNPYVQALVIDWGNDKVFLKLYDDIQAIRNAETTNEASVILKERMNQQVFNEIARVSSITDELINPDSDQFSYKTTRLINPKSFLLLDLGKLADQQSREIAEQVERAWSPKHADLTRENFPIREYDVFKNQSAQDQKLGLVIYAPSKYAEEPPLGFTKDSIYVIARGMDAIIQKYKEAPKAPESQALMADVRELGDILKKNGFIGYSGHSYGIAPEFSKDFIFKLDDYYSMLLKAAREDFYVKGSKRYAVLDFTNVEQRILTDNKIADRIQEDLLKWREEYNSAQVDINTTSRYQVPKPTKNVYWENFKLTLSKYFHGDDRKILKWGLDLSGGKTVRIGLRDQNNRPVTEPDDLKQAVNELYNRINKMGVANSTIRIENNNILLDFPGSQGLSASELVKASAMYFHIVNEKFTPRNQALGLAVNGFLEEVWNEAVVTNKKDVESINEIAYKHLGGAEGADQNVAGRSEHAKTLYDNGLRIANPKEASVSNAFNDQISSVAVMRGDDFAEWGGQSHPLLFVFHNYALEGSSLTDVNVGYDPSEGNILSFKIKGSYEGAGRSGNPRDDFYTWTSQFSEDNIAGTPKEAYTGGHGWRMAVILNGQVISSPALRAALRDGATISGRFSQREVNQLAADLKAGSLSFTPKILSEENVSPELGLEERNKGIIASTVALMLVVAAMIAYYHFAGVVASAAVLFNILIMWGVLQNLGAAITLPGIAGIVLTIGMAVDANVLVFERFREEFRQSGRIASAIQAGYRKAFSAIVDSNVTTIIAALILIQFDSGPVKGFAVTLIIGIISSMFTALFMTRYFFARWVQNPKNKTLTMSQFIHNTKFNFLAQTNKALIISGVVAVLGTFLFLAQKNTIFGMDFTGGYSLTVELQEKPGMDKSYRLEAFDALLAKGATSNDLQVRELSKPTLLRIQLGMGMEEPGHPFYMMPDHLTEGKFKYDYQSNPRISWVVDALQSKGLTIDQAEFSNLEKNWTVMSGQFSDAMRNNALIGLGIALLCILVYITIRFEWKYAVSSVIGLIYDVILTMGIFAMFHKLGFAVQIDLETVGAIMTIVGYALNDTIIVFDRIREDAHVFRKWKFEDVVNHALNVTLSRTIMTSGTTLLVLLTLVLLGGHSIFGFALVMTIGVIVGTLSSLFIASPMLVWYHNYELRKQHEHQIALKNS